MKPVVQYLDWYGSRSPELMDGLGQLRARCLVVLVHIQPLLSVAALTFSQTGTKLAFGPWPVLIALASLFLLRRTGNIKASALLHFVAHQVFVTTVILHSKTFISTSYLLVPFNVIIASLLLDHEDALSLALFLVGLSVLALFFSGSIGMGMPFGMTLEQYASLSYFTIVVEILLVAVFVYHFERLRQLKEDQIVQTQQRLNRSSRMVSMGNLVGSINHEFNNSLAILDASLSFLEIAEDQETEWDKRIKSVNRIDHALQRLDFLMAGLKSSHEPIELDLLPISTLCARVLIYNEPTLKRFGRQLSFKDYTGNAVVRLSSHILLRVLEALIANACEACEQSGSISITIARSGQRLEFQVIDTGSGISDSIAPRIFEPFFSTRRSRSAKGLGLSIARGLIESQQGSLNLLPAPDQTVFIVTVPTSAPDRSPEIRS